MRKPCCRSRGGRAWSSSKPACLDSANDRLDRPAEVASPREALVSPGERQLSRRVARIYEPNGYSAAEFRPRSLRRTARQVRRASGGGRRTSKHPAVRRTVARQRAAGLPAGTPQTVAGASAGRPLLWDQQGLGVLVAWTLLLFRIWRANIGCDGDHPKRNPCVVSTLSCSDFCTEPYSSQCIPVKSLLDRMSPRGGGHCGGGHCGGGRCLLAGVMSPATTHMSLRERAYPPPQPESAKHNLEAQPRSTTRHTASTSYQLSSKPSTLRTIAPLAISMKTVLMEVDCASTG